MNNSIFNSFKPSRMWNPAEIAADARRAWELLLNRKVPFYLKFVLPLGALAYWFMPVDLIPFLPIDDIAVVLVAMRMFVMLGNRAVGFGGIAGSGGETGPTVDTTWRVVNETPDDSTPSDSPRTETPGNSQ
jgi:hypothetical protein